MHAVDNVRKDTIARRGQHLPHKMRVRRVHPVRRGLMRLLIVRVLPDMAVMRPVGLRARYVRRDTINPVRVIHHVQTVVRDITVPVVRHVRRVRRVHTVQRTI